MHTENGQSVSIWMQQTPFPTYAPLTKTTHVDVCVIGAGMAGLSTAYQLCQAGAQVFVVDDGQVGAGESGRTTAQLTCMLDRGYSETEQRRGQAAARLTAESHMAAIDTIEQIVQRERIQCDFARMNGYLFLAPDDQRKTLEDEQAAATRAGLDVDLLEYFQIASREVGPTLRFRRQGQFHILKYLHGLAAAIENMGGTIACNTHVQKIQSGHPLQLTTNTKAQITANAVVLCTNVPINDVFVYSSKLSPHRTYVIGMQVPRGSLPTALYFDTAEPYHYVRLQPEAEYDVLIVGGEDHKTGQGTPSEHAYTNLETWARDFFPMAQQVLYRWSGQVVNSIDGLALLGRDLVDDNVYVITGDNGMGMTHATIGSLIVSDLIAGRNNPWAELYHPARLPLTAVGDFLQEGLNVATQLRDWVSSGDATSIDDIPLNSGALIGWGTNQRAVYRDPQGQVHQYSAVCPHLGCIVKWNDLEKTWDCPCHGSRFTCHGRVVNGPAAKNLNPA
jgi:glycine/D-amino acid oxidase-like deaminating enzyme/nitrite reductase/ring-hydroxylating ferredoxin subunit